MSTTAQSIIKSAQTALNDLDGTRWPATDLVDYLNLGQLELVRARPDQKANTATVSLVAGYRQAVPAEVMDLIDIPSNGPSGYRRITKVDHYMLDMVSPGWRGSTSSTTIQHFMHDQREPLIFLVYPPASSGASVVMTYSVIPTAVPAPTGPSYSTVSGNLDVQDQWAEPLLNFVLYKAYAKDAEFGSAQLSASYYGMFQSAVGTQLQASSTVAPKE